MAKKLPPLLSEKHLDTLNKVIKSCQDTAGYCEACQACGLDVAKEARDNAEQLAMAEQLKRTFFPDKV